MCFNDFECMIHATENSEVGGVGCLYMHMRWWHQATQPYHCRPELGSDTEDLDEISTNFDLRSLPEMEDVFVSPRTNMRQRAMVDRSQSVRVYQCIPSF